MRKIVVAAFVSVDGVMQAPGGPEEDRSGGFRYGGWMAPFWDDASAQSISESFSEPFDLLLGRKTYDIFASYWPKMAVELSAKNVDSLDAEIARRFDACTKYVATHRPDSLSWQHSEALGKDAIARLRELKRQDGPCLLTQGSSELVQQLFESDLVDELRLWTFPLLLGQGKRVFGGAALPAGLKLTKSITSPNGAVIARYERAGEVKTGSFAEAEAGEDQKKNVA